MGAASAEVEVFCGEAKVSGAVGLKLLSSLDIIVFPSDCFFEKFIPSRNLFGRSPSWISQGRPKNVQKHRPGNSRNQALRFSFLPGVSPGRSPGGYDNFGVFGVCGSKSSGGRIMF
jgi:hypothetical protein